MSTSRNDSHYDSSLEYNVDMYDMMPYERDVTLCGSAQVALQSGNIIKYYSYNEKPYLVSNQDDLTKAYISKQEQGILKKIQDEHDEYIKEAIEEGLADQKIADEAEETDVEESI